MNKAHVALTIKTVDDEARLIEGWATRPEKDRVGDIVVPTGVEYKLPLPFLLDHDHSQAVGEVDHVEVSDEGIKFRAHIKKIDEPGPVKDLVDKAWQLVKHGLRRSVSIGFAPKEFDVLPSGGLKYKTWEWLELSAVSVPALASANITGTKSFRTGELVTTVTHDTGAPDLSAAEAEIHPEPPAAASGKKQVRVVRLNDPARDRAKPFVIRSIKR